MAARRNNGCIAIVQQNWVLSELQGRKRATESIAILATLSLCGCYIDFSASKGNPLTVIMLVAFWIATAYGMIRVLGGVVDFLKSPSRPRIGDGGGATLWGLTGYGDWDDFGGHRSAHSGGGCGDCSSG